MSLRLLLLCRRLYVVAFYLAFDQHGAKFILMTVNWQDVVAVLSRYFTSSVTGLYERAAGRRTEEQRNEVAPSDSWHWSAAGGSIGRVDADGSSVPHQAATVDLQRAWVRDPRQCAILHYRRTATTFQETTTSTRLRKSLPTQ